MYTGISSKLKINGHISALFDVNNGVRQGCCVAPSLFVIVQEVLLRSIREDTALKGIHIPGPRGETGVGQTFEMRERAFADDTGVALENDSQIQTLQDIIVAYEKVSGGKFNTERYIGLRFGPTRNSQPPTKYKKGGSCPMRWYRYGIDRIPSNDKYLGITLDTSDHSYPMERKDTKNWLGMHNCHCSS